MKKEIQFVALLLALTLLLGAAAIPALAADAPVFSDVDTNHWSYPYVTWAAECGLVKGVGDNKFSPDSLVTRAQFVTMIGRALGWEYETLEGDTWYDGYVRYANEHGYFSNKNDLDHSRHNEIESDKNSLNTGIPREEMALLVANTQLRNIKLLRDDATLFPDALETGNRWHVVWCFERGILTGYKHGEFKGQGVMTRAEACTVLQRLVEYYEVHKNERAGLPETTDIPQWHWCYDYLDWAWKEGILQEYDSSENQEGKLISKLNKMMDDCAISIDYFIRSFNQVMPENVALSTHDVPNDTYKRNGTVSCDYLFNLAYRLTSDSSKSLGIIEGYLWAMDNNYYPESISDASQYGSYRNQISSGEEKNIKGNLIYVHEYIYLLYHLADHFDLIAPEDKIIEKDTRRYVLPQGVDTSAWVNEPIKNLTQEQVELAVQSELARLIVEYYQQENGATMPVLVDASQMDHIAAEEYYTWNKLGQFAGTGVWAHSRLNGLNRGSIGLELFGMTGSGSEVATIYSVASSNTPAQIATTALNNWKNSSSHNYIILELSEEYGRPNKAVGCGIYYKNNQVSCIANFMPVE